MKKTETTNKRQIQVGRTKKQRIINKRPATSPLRCPQPFLSIPLELYPWNEPENLPNIKVDLK